MLHVRLLNEGTDVFRPVLAEALGDGVYELVASADYDPDDEQWEFEPGSHVSAAPRRGELGEFLVATPLLAAVSSADAERFRIRS